MNWLNNTLHKIKSIPLFTSMVRSGNSPQSRVPVSETLPTSPPSTLRHIHEIDVNAWVKCYCENDLRPLIIDGKPTPEQLQERFQEILIEYHDRIGSHESRSMVSMRKKIVRTRAKLIIVPMLIQNYLLTGKKELKDLAAKYSFRFESTMHPELIIKHLQAHIKNWEVELDMYQKDLDNYIAARHSDDKVTRETFIKNIVHMRKEGFDVSMKTMLDEYAVSIQLFNQYIESKTKEVR
jgi:hypothetical protein